MVKGKEISIDPQIIVECIGSIVNSVRESGQIEILTKGVEVLDTCKDVVFDCGCIKQKDLEVGLHKYTIIDPHYMFGNKAEVQRIFDKKDKDNANKYPVIILEQPFVENPTKHGIETTVRLLIASFVKKEEDEGNPVYKTSYQERFKVTLYPLYNKFIKQLRKSPLVKAHDIVSKTDRPLFGEKALMSSDFWDVIDVKIKITFGKSCQIKVCEKLIYGN